SSRQGREGDVMNTRTLPPSSLRTQGPIATGFHLEGRRLPLRQPDGSRGMGPCVRRDDKVGCARLPQTPLSSPGLTGRPSTPRPIRSIERPLEYWIPAFAGMTSCAWGDEKETQTQC